MTEIGRAMGSPHRFGYGWHIVGDREDATDVDISFDAHAGATLVTVVHSGGSGSARQEPEGGSATTVAGAACSATTARPSSQYA